MPLHSPLRVSGRSPEAQKLKEYLQDEFSRFQAERVQRERSWNEWYAQYRGRLTPSTGSHDTKSQLFIQATRQAVRSAVSNIMTILFQQLPPFIVVGRSTHPDSEIARMVQQLVWYALNPRKFIVSARRYITNASIYGTSCAKILLDIRKVGSIAVEPYRDILTGFPAGTKRLFASQEEYRLHFAPIDPWDIWIDPSAQWGEDLGNGVFHRYWRTISWIKQRVKDNIFYEPTQDDFSPRPIASTTTDRRRSLVGLPPLVRSKYERSIIEAWFTFPSELLVEAGLPDPGVEECPAVVTFLGDENGVIQDILRIEKNVLPEGIKPFVADIWEDVGEGLYGSGTPEVTRGAQTALNVTVNSRIDNKGLAINQILGVNIDMIEDPDDLRSRPNWIIRFNGDPRAGLFPVPVPDITSQARLEQLEFERLIEEAAGISKFVQGTESFGSNRTAAGIATVYQAASRFLRDIAFQFEQNLIAHTARLAYQHILLFFPDELLVQITDNPQAPEFRKIALEGLPMDVDFIPSGITGIANREVTINQMIQFLQASLHPAIAPFVNLPFLLKKIYSAFSPTDVEDVIRESAPIPSAPFGAPPGAPPGSAPEVPVGELTPTGVVVPSTPEGTPATVS